MGVDMERIGEFEQDMGLEVEDWFEQCAPAVIAADSRQSILIVTAADAIALDGASFAEAAGDLGFRVLGSVSTGALADRLARTIRLDQLLVDLRHSQDGAIARFARDVVELGRVGWPKTLVLVDLAGLDLAVRLLDHENVEILCAPSSLDIVSALIMSARAEMSDGATVTLHDIGRERDSRELAKLSDEVRRLAATIERLGRQGEAAPPHGQVMPENVVALGDNKLGYHASVRRDHEAKWNASQAGEGVSAAVAPNKHDVLALIRARRLRDQFLPADLFADPAWDMMLDLLAARLAGARVSVSSLCIAASVPPTTALRWIKQLTDRGVFARVDDPSDGRRVFIELTESAERALTDWACAVRSNGGVLGGRPL